MMKRALSRQSVRGILRECGGVRSALQLQYRGCPPASSTSSFSSSFSAVASASHACSRAGLSPASPCESSSSFPHQPGYASALRHRTNTLRLQGTRSSSYGCGGVVDPGDLRSPYSDIQLPETPFGEFMLKRCDMFKDNVAVSDYLTGRQYTYKQLKDFTIRVASALHKRGFRKGDVITSYATNMPEFSILCMAVACLGVILSPANPTAAELGQMLSHNGASAIFTIPQLMPSVQEAMSSKDVAHKVKEVFYLFGQADEGAQSFQTLMEDDGKAFPENVDIDPRKDILFLPYSSGTTGLPKGVMLSHYNITSNLLQLRPWVKLGLLPFSHIFGLTVVQFGTLNDGGHLVTVPKFDQEVFLKVLQEKKITVMHIVPPIVLFLAKHPMVSNFDLSSIDYCICGAAPLGQSLVMECQNRLSFPIFQGYGLTETSPVVTLDCDPGHAGTIGFIFPNTKAKMVDVETGLPVKIGEMGEFWVDGPQKMLGYLNNQKATDEMIDKDGWLHTGDLGYVREDGTIVLQDRLKELIKYKGYQVPPAELEGLLLTHPDVQDVGVVGIPEEGVGELPRAYIVLKPGATTTAQDISKYVEEKAAPSKKLRGGVEFVDEIPKNASGKILRRVLKAKALKSS